MAESLCQAFRTDQVRSYKISAFAALFRGFRRSRIGSQIQHFAKKVRANFIFKPPFRPDSRPFRSDTDSAIRDAAGPIPIVPPNTDPSPAFRRAGTGRAGRPARPSRARTKGRPRIACPTG